jgi:flagellar assembly protein FliH
MGKIVRGARIAGGAYVVAVPETVPEIRRNPNEEQDQRFAPRPDAPVFDESDDDVFAELGTAPSPLPPEPRVDFEQLRADAQKLIDAAESDGEALLQHAAQRARELVDRATARVAEIEAEARAKGHEEGVAAGRASANAELAESVGAMHELVQNALAQRHEVIEGAEPELVTLAIAIAERVLHDHLSVSPAAVLENVRHSLARLVGREVVTLRVNPADLETIRQHRDGIASSNDVEHLRIVEDQRVDRGGVVVETDAGTIDAKIGTQLREVRRALQNGDAIALAPAHEAPAVPAQAS